jgi:oxygen-dependent protoporphyrinogen oxidase
MIAIVGGGISGLAAAYELFRRNVRFDLFEQADRLGGLVRTERVSGFTIEAGADSVLVQKPAALDLCRELGLHTLLTTRRPRQAFVLDRGRLHPLPSPGMLGIPATWRGLATYSLFSPLARVRLALEPVVPARTDAGDEAVAAFFRRRFGAASVARIAQPLIGGIHAGDVTTLSMSATLPRLAAVERSRDSVLSWVRRSAPTTDTDGAFRSLPKGMSQLVEGIVERVPAASIHLDHGVERLERDGEEWALSSLRGRSRHRAVIMACPAHAAARLLGGIDAAAARLCSSVPYASTVSIALGFAREAVTHPLEGSGFVVARRRGPGRLTACTWVSSKWAERAPHGQVLLRAYAGGMRDPSVVDLPDEELVSTALRELTPVLGLRSGPSLARVYRWRRAGAQHEVGHGERMASLRERLQGAAGIFVAGSGFGSIGIPDCVADGRAAAAAAVSFIHAT